MTRLSTILTMLVCLLAACAGPQAVIPTTVPDTDRSIPPQGGPILPPTTTPEMITPNPTQEQPGVPALTPPETAPTNSGAGIPATPTATTAKTEPATATHAPTSEPTIDPEESPASGQPNPLTIQYMRQQTYPGSDITIEQTLAPGANYDRYIASYRSEGLKIYALLTVPQGQKPESGWPVIIFNHGYIPPNQYRTTERYVAYVDALARSGYIVFKSDYRGHGNSEGGTPGGYGSPAYTIDVLNALGSIERYPDADQDRIGMWGHSLGGHVTLRSMVVTQNIKAGVIWAGVVGSYPELLNHWRQPSRNTPTIPINARRWRQEFIEQYGTPEENPEFWASISPNTYVADLSGPIELHHGTVDSEVPLAFSQELYDEVKAAGKTIEFYTYPGSDHNISQGFTLAMQRTVAFFDKYVKGN